MFNRAKRELLIGASLVSIGHFLIYLERLHDFPKKLLTALYYLFDYWCGSFNYKSSWVIVVSKSDDTFK